MSCIRSGFFVRRDLERGKRLGSIAVDGQKYEFEDANQSWLASWHLPSESSITGQRHGSGAVCRTSDGQIVLISQDGVKWEHPAGRTEGDEHEGSEPKHFVIEKHAEPVGNLNRIS